MLVLEGGRLEPRVVHLRHDLGRTVRVEEQLAAGVADGPVLELHGGVVQEQDQPVAGDDRLRADLDQELAERALRGGQRFSQVNRSVEVARLSLALVRSQAV